MLQYSLMLQMNDTYVTYVVLEAIYVIITEQ